MAEPSIEELKENNDKESCSPALHSIATGEATTSEMFDIYPVDKLTNHNLQETMMMVAYRCENFLISCRFPELTRLGEPIIGFNSLFIGFRR